MNNLRFFGGFFFKKKNCLHLEFLANQIFWQNFMIIEKLMNRGQLLLKLRVVEVATPFH